MPLCAEVSELRISKQYGLPYHNVVIVEQQQLIEKHAKARGVDLKVRWVTLGSGVLNSTDVMGGPATITVIFGAVKFHDSNPKTIAALYAALGEAAEFIVKDKRAAAELYLKATKEKISVDELVSMLDFPTFVFAQAPNGTLKYAEQMFKTGVIKTRPTRWKDAFFPESHLLPGS